MSETTEATSVVVRRGMWRSRWAAIGAAVAVSLGAGGLFVAQAAPGPSESTIVTVSPERILDTRDPNNIGLDGPFTSAVSQKLKVTGSIETATGTKTVVPTGATGVLLNVTPVNPTAAGFISIRPGDATGAATTSSLNFTTGVAGIVPNAVQVAVPTAGTNEGEIDITYDAYGQAGPTTDILIDVVGYMTSAGLQDFINNTYTKAEVDAKFASTVDLQIGIASATADNATVNWTSGCVSAPTQLRLGVDVPVGATITSITGYILGSGGQLSLVRTTGAQTTLATATSTSGALASVSSNLATPETVNAGEFFFLEFTGTQLLCGAAIRYTIPAGTSAQLDGPGTPDGDAPTGQ